MLPRWASRSAKPRSTFFVRNVAVWSRCDSNASPRRCGILHRSHEGFGSGLIFLVGLAAETQRQRSPKRWCAFLSRSLSPRRLEFPVTNEPQVRFEERGPDLVAVEIGQRSCSPLVGSVHRALFAIGVEISSYRARPSGGGLVEHLVLERQGGGRIDAALSVKARAAILPIALRVLATESPS